MAQNQGLPTPGYPFVDPTGKINPIWFQFLQSLWQRTGGGTGEGSVQSVSVQSANGISSEVTNPTTNPVISLTLGQITPLSVVAPGSITAGGTLSGAGLQVGTYVPGAVAVTGYILITDSTGTPRRLMVS